MVDGVEHALGAESQAETGEPHALEKADSTVQQAITVCFAVDYLPGEDHTIDKPATYTLWRDYRPPGWPGKLLDWTAPKALLAEIEAEVKPQIMPFYACDCPRGHKGKWTRLSDRQVMGDDFDATALSPEERKGYRYEGPEIVYVFWAKHGPCQVTGCGHRTPVMTSPVMALKTLSVKTWSRRCRHCGEVYDLEERDARMAPGVPLVVAESEQPYAVATLCPGSRDTMIPDTATCPLCKQVERFNTFGNTLEGKPRNKSIDLTLLVHSAWLRGESPKDSQGRPYGGSADDEVEATIRWNNARAATCRLVEVRGKLPDEVTWFIDLPAKTDYIDHAATGDFMGENICYFGYGYEDGSFHYDSDDVSMNLAPGQVTSYQVQYSVKGSFTDVLLNIGNADRYTYWVYQTDDSCDIGLALSENKALVIYETDTAFLVMNILGGVDSGITPESLESFVNSFTLSLLK